LAAENPSGRRPAVLCTSEWRNADGKLNFSPALAFRPVDEVVHVYVLCSCSHTFYMFMIMIIFVYM
jgi:hypothetical protein